MGLEATLSRLRSGLQRKELSKTDYDFEVSLAKQFARAYGPEPGRPNRCEKTEPASRAGEVEVELKSIITQTPKAWLVQPEEFPKRWFPKSRCRLEGKSLFVPQWLYNKLLEEQDEKPKPSNHQPRRSRRG